jgi:hypothetical protein
MVNLGDTGERLRSLAVTEDTMLAVFDDHKPAVSQFFETLIDEMTRQPIPP